MEKPCPFSNCSPKEEALYKSVLALLDEGYVLIDLKVSDIAKKAGVGKGTTYEYFKSKEELIGKALFYSLHLKIQNLLYEIRKEKGFRNILYAIFNWMDENLNADHFLYQILSIDGVGYKIPEEVRTVLLNETRLFQIIQEKLGEFGKCAAQEGLIPKDASQNLVNISIINGIISYMVYLRFQKTMNEVNKDQMKAFVYNSILGAFRV